MNEGSALLWALALLFIALVLVWHDDWPAGRYA